MDIKRLILLCSLFLCLLFACTKTTTIQVKDPGTKTLADVLKNNFSFSLFYAAAKKAGLEQQLATDTLTVLVPDNTALNKVSIFNESTFNTWNADSLKRWVQYHIVQGKVLYEDVPQTLDNLYNSLTGDVLYFSKPLKAPVLPAKILHINGDTANAFNIAAGNGVVHVLTQPLKLPVASSVQSFLEADTSYSFFITALKKFGLYDQLNQPGPFTVIAPVNAVFRTLRITADSISKLDTMQYKKVLFGCYVYTPSRFFISDFQDAPGKSYSGIALPGDELYYTPDCYFDFNYTTLNCSYRALGYTTANQYLGGGLTRAQSLIAGRNNITGNGIVHQLTGNLVLWPNEMKRP